MERGRKKEKKEVGSENLWTTIRIAPPDSKA